VKAIRETELLFLSESRALFQVGACAETRVYVACYDQCSCGPRLALVVYAGYLVVQLGEQLLRDGVAGGRSVERENSYATAVWCWDACHTYGRW
jgi:hypothetical protein